MAKPTADQIVSALLEYGYSGEQERPGSPDDPWRKGGYKKINLAAGNFTGTRPGETPKPEEEETEHEHEKPAIPTAKRRFLWKPPGQQ